MDDKELSVKIEELKSSDLDRVRNSIRELGYSGDRRAVPVLMEMLSKEKSIGLKNALALSLGDLGADEAVPLLMSLIKEPEYENRRGSFVYALRNLNCRRYFLDIVDLICTGHYEVYHHALDIFESIVDNVSYEEKVMARERLQMQEQIELLLPPTKNPKYDRIHFLRDALKLID